MALSMNNSTLTFEAALTLPTEAFGPSAGAIRLAGRKTAKFSRKESL